MMKGTNENKEEGNEGKGLFINNKGFPDPKEFKFQSAI